LTILENCCIDDCYGLASIMDSDQTSRLQNLSMGLEWFLATPPDQGVIHPGAIGDPDLQCAKKARHSTKYDGNGDADDSAPVRESGRLVAVGQLAYVG